MILGEKILLKEVTLKDFFNCILKFLPKKIIYFILTLYRIQAKRMFL